MACVLKIRLIEHYQAFLLTHEVISRGSRDRDARDRGARDRGSRY